MKTNCGLISVWGKRVNCVMRRRVSPAACITVISVCLQALNLSLPITLQYSRAFEQATGLWGNTWSPDSRPLFHSLAAACKTQSIWWYSCTSTTIIFVNQDNQKELINVYYNFIETDSLLLKVAFSYDRSTSKFLSLNNHMEIELIRNALARHVLLPQRE